MNKYLGIATAVTWFKQYFGTNGHPEVRQIFLELLEQKVAQKFDLAIKERRTDTMEYYISCAYTIEYPARYIYDEAITRTGFDASKGIALAFPQEWGMTIYPTHIFTNGVAITMRKNTLINKNNGNKIAFPTA